VNIPNELFYTKDHEWARFEGSEVTIGITDFAQGELGDIIYVEFPDVGQEVQKGDPLGTIEAVKTVADIYAPITGKVTAVNNDLEDAPERVNNDPYGEGWMIRLEAVDPSDREGLLSAADYRTLID